MGHRGGRGEGGGGGGGGCPNTHLTEHVCGVNVFNYNIICIIIYFPLYHQKRMYCMCYDCDY